MSDFDIRELARIIDRAEPCVCKPPRTNAAADTIAYLGSCAPVEAGPEVSDLDPLPWKANGDHLSAVVVAANGGFPVGSAWHLSASAVVHRVNNWDTLRAQLVATRAQLDDALVRNVLEQDEHSAERAKLARERDAALAEVERLRATNIEVTARYHELLNQLDCAEQDRDHVRQQLKAAGIACACGGVACPFCGDSDARLVP